MDGEFDKFCDFDDGFSELCFLLSDSSLDVGDRDLLREGAEGLNTAFELEELFLLKEDTFSNSG